MIALGALAWLGYSTKSDGTTVAFLRGRVPIAVEYQLFAVDRISAHGTRIRFFNAWQTGRTNLRTGSMPWKAETAGDRTICIRRYAIDIEPQDLSPSIQDQLAAEGFSLRYATGLAAAPDGDSEFYKAQRANGDQAVISWFRPNEGQSTLVIEIERATTLWEKAESLFRRVFSRH